MSLKEKVDISEALRRALENLKPDTMTLKERVENPEALKSALENLKPDTPVYDQLDDLPLGACPFEMVNLLMQTCDAIRTGLFDVSEEHQKQLAAIMESAKEARERAEAFTGSMILSWWEILLGAKPD